MKKSLVILLFLAQTLPAQFTQYDSLDGDVDMVQTFMIPLLIMIVVFTGVFYIISIIEGAKKVEDHSVKNINSDIWKTLIISVLVIILLLWAFSDNPLLVVLPVKLIMAFLVSENAKKKNRSAVLWWILGFIEFHSALAVLALTKGILEVKESNNEHDVVFNTKLIKLNDMLQEGLISRSEFITKKEELDAEYRKSGYLIKQQSQLKEKETLKSKLELAFKDGLLTEEEYYDKINKTNSVEDTVKVQSPLSENIEVEKEKLRNLHSNGEISYEEMKERFRQIDGLHRID